MKVILVLLIASVALTACGRKGDPEAPQFTQSQ
jgi:predicted small lipoprotein YifL